MSNFNWVNTLNLIYMSTATLCALYVSYTALVHTAKPNLIVKMLEPTRFESGQEITLIFEFLNIGHWYAKPAVIDLTVFINFDQSFEPIELRYGSTQEFSSTSVRIGKGKMKYLKAKGIKLIYGEDGEQIHVRVKAPRNAGQHLIKISAFSANQASLGAKFNVWSVKRETSEY